MVSSRKKKAEAVGNVSKRKKIKEAVSESDLELKEISDYVDSGEDVAKRSVSGDSEESERSGRKNDDGDNDPLSVSSFSRFISVERYDLQMIMDKVRYLTTKISVRSRMAAYREFKQVFVDQELKKRFNDDDEDLGGDPVGVRVGDDASLSTSKDAAGTSSLGDLHKGVVVLEETLLNIAAYIREKRLKKKENDERQRERGEERKEDEEEKEAEEASAAAGEERKEDEEEKEAEEASAAADTEKEGEQGKNEAAAVVVEKKELKLKMKRKKWQTKKKENIKKKNKKLTKKM
ncbi:nucleoplasmin-like protein ANO39 [Capsicum annuum]|uniref:nucleoplasmin-like protein ANO39 n=1 Tax=Capsicum annuum TaxID=4072 RepID=UPI001FB0BFC4|nr:nucleoplasmin-like protein ANO39 [Capsicum annuum]